jgi:hypothetical protein
MQNERGDKMKLYEILESIQRILVNDELSSEEQRGALDHLDLAFDIKSVDAEIQRLKKQKESLVNRVKSVESYSKYALTTAGRDNAGTSTYGVSLRTAPRKVVVVDEDRISEEWYRTEVVRKLDKKKMIEQWDGRKHEHAETMSCFGFTVVRERYPKFPKIQTNTERSNQE